MKKTLIAAALLAGFAGAAAHAQTSVTLYGRVDAGLEYSKVKIGKGVAAAKGYFGANKTSASHIGMGSGNNSSSRWGLRGSEDLGDGLRAVFQLESGFSLRDGRLDANGSPFGRQATLGLASDSWGQLDFGRQLTLGNKYLGDIDPNGTNFGQSSLGHTFSAAAVRWDNMVLYRTPDINGFQAGIGYSFAKTHDNAEYKTGDNRRGLTAGVRYLNGPLNVAATYEQLRDKSDANGATPAKGTKPAVNNSGAKPKMYGIGLTYDLEVVKLAAAYARTTDGWLGGSGLPGNAVAMSGSSNNPYGETFAKGSKVNSTMLGLTAPLGNGSTVFTSWQRAKPNNDRLSRTRVGAIANTAQDKAVNIYSVGYTYDFSKRTNLYTHASYASNFGFISGVKSTALSAGLLHRF